MVYIERIRAYRKENKITQKQIAERIGIDERQYWKYEAGRNELPIRYLALICKEYNIDANWLLGLTETPQP